MGRAGRGGGCLRLMPSQRASSFLDRNCDLDQHRARHRLGSRKRQGGITGPGSLASYGGCFTCGRLPRLLGSSRLRGLRWLQHKCHVGSDARQACRPEQGDVAEGQCLCPVQGAPEGKALGMGSSWRRCWQAHRPRTPSDELLRSPAQAPGPPHRLCLLSSNPGRASASFLPSAQPHWPLTGGSHGEGPGRAPRTLLGCSQADLGLP